MSLPLTRRIAQAALLVAAGAVPVVAASGTASAAELPRTADLGGLTQLDSDSLATHVQGVAHQTGRQVGKTGSSAVAAGVPTVADTLGATAAAAVPQVNKLAGAAAQQAGATAATTGTMAAGAAQRAVAPVSGGNPVSALTGALPLGQLPLAPAGGAHNRLGGLPDLGSGSSPLSSLTSLTSVIRTISGAATQGPLQGAGSPLGGLPL
ncbi:ATP-binding protein [Streptomyces sp. NPDC092296]|uniref:ATP-binding protein n=1 Tax=Streptomyces sp. NPDC092296 TaxID=3366012 RepID=UPI00381D2793